LIEKAIAENYIIDLIVFGSYLLIRISCKFLSFSLSSIYSSQLFAVENSVASIFRGYLMQSKNRWSCSITIGESIMTTPLSRRFKKIAFPWCFSLECLIRFPICPLLMASSLFWMLTSSQVIEHICSPQMRQRFKSERAARGNKLHFSQRF